jgi:hypothetical protein
VVSRDECEMNARSMYGECEVNAGQCEVNASSYRPMRGQCEVNMLSTEECNVNSR